MAEKIAFIIGMQQKKEQIEKFYEKSLHEVKKDDDLHILDMKVVKRILGREIQRNKRYKTQLSIVIFEIDYFQNLSNVFEAEKIKMLKKDTINIVRSSIRDTDVLGEWENNQFIILALDTGFKGAKHFGEKLVETIAREKFANVGRVTFSAGVTSISTQDVNLISLAKRAEDAVEDAKKQGGNKVEVNLLI